MNFETLNNRVTTAITAHLLNIDPLPPAIDVANLARDLTDVVFNELAACGLSQLQIEALRSPGTRAGAAR